MPPLGLAPVPADSALVSNDRENPCLPLGTTRFSQKTASKTNGKILQTKEPRSYWQGAQAFLQRSDSVAFQRFLESSFTLGNFGFSQ
jgi:hypothetical protein